MKVSPASFNQIIDATFPFCICRIIQRKNIKMISSCRAREKKDDVYEFFELSAGVFNSSFALIVCTQEFTFNARCILSKVSLIDFYLSQSHEYIFDK